MILTSIVNIAKICAQKGVKHVVLSPGSRCAHLTMAFVRHPHIKTYTIADERSAAFIAIGMALSLKSPVAIVCTSGTAALNYYPAIAEAYYQKIPLIVFTADRPSEWVDQLDGQTIRQENVYANHVLKSFSLPTELEHPEYIWHSGRLVNEAINLAISSKGPVHLNVPIREPFYPEPTENMDFESYVSIIDEVSVSPQLSELLKIELRRQISNHQKIVVVAGQGEWPQILKDQLQDLAQSNKIVLVTDSISNLQSANSIDFQDILLTDKSIHNQLKPSLVITFGLSLISKNLKLFLRNSTQIEHWHVAPNGEIADTFKKLAKIIRINPEDFFDIKNSLFLNKLDQSFVISWKMANKAVQEQLSNYFKTELFSEFEAIYTIIKANTQNINLHFANSMAVRYGNYISCFNTSGQITVRSNRGTSGIDGCTSTALGDAMVSNKPVVLITGDMAFFYDRNAFWNKYVPPHFKIVLLNNHAGGIFRIIDGPNRQPELEEYFETIQPLNANNCAKDFNLDYLLISSREQIQESIEWLYQTGTKAKLLEIETEGITNTEVLKKFIRLFKKE